MARYSFYLDENVPQEKALMDYLDPIGTKKGNAIKYLLIQGLTLNGISSTVIEKEKEVESITPKTIEQDDNDLNDEDINVEI